MGQREVLDILIKEEKWLTADDICNKVDFCNRAGVNYSLRMLMKAGLVEHRESKKFKHGYEYRIIVDYNEKIS